MNDRFTVDGSDTLERRLSGICDEVAEGVRGIVPAAQLEGVLLGGGYGRGEGGVLRSEEGDMPYNDLEFYVFISGAVPISERRYGHALHQLGEALTPRIGIEVEFKILSREKLRRSPVSMFYYDLIVGHRRLIGGAELLAGCEHHQRAENIPLHEATRLLMNRCSGLLYSLDRLRRADFTASDADFVGRNLAKAQMALGDVVLVAHRQYHASCRERGRRLCNLNAGDQSEWLDAVRTHHAIGVEFKLHPVRSRESAGELDRRHAELSEVARRLWLWLESRRLGCVFGDVSSYVLSRINKCPETSMLRNWLVTVRRRGFGAGLSMNAMRYPRERLFNALCLLLWEPDATRDARLCTVLREQLLDNAIDLAGWVAVYERWWRQFN